MIPADGLLPLIEVYSWRLIYAAEDRRNELDQQDRTKNNSLRPVSARKITLQLLHTGHAILAECAHPTPKRGR